MVKFKKFMAALLSGAMLLGITASAAPVSVVAHAAEDKRDIASAKIICDYAYFKPTSKGFWMNAQAYDSKGNEVPGGFGSFSWVLKVNNVEVDPIIEGTEEGTEGSVYLGVETYWDEPKGSSVYLHIKSGVEDKTKIEITATSVYNPEVTASYTGTVDTTDRTAARIELKMDEDPDFGELGQLGSEVYMWLEAYTEDGTWIWDWEPNEEKPVKWEVGGMDPWSEDMGKIEDDPYPNSYYNSDGKDITLYIGTEEEPGKKITVSATYDNLSSQSHTITVWNRKATGIFLEPEPPKNMVGGQSTEISAFASDEYSDEYGPLYNDITWSVIGIPAWTNAIEEENKSYFKIDEDDESTLHLYIGEDEEIIEKFTITATSKSNPSLSVSHTITVRDVGELVTSTIELQYDEYVAVGGSIDIEAIPRDLNDEEIDDVIDWEITGEKDKEGTRWERKSNTKMVLYIGENEPEGTEITVTAKSSNSGISESCTITVSSGISFDINYKEGSAHLRSNGGDSFLFLEVHKNDTAQKGQGTIYCYEGKDISVDLSTMKLSKDISLYVYGDVNTEPKEYTIAAQPKKASVKFKYNPEGFAKCFTLGSLKMEDFEYRRQNETSWKPLSELEKELDQLMVMGANLLVRQGGKDTKDKKNMPGTEIKLKIPAAPKAPKIKLNYAKNTITLAKNSQIRVPGWEVFSDKPNENGKYEKVPFYYPLGDTKDKEKLNPSPADLADTLLTAYITDYDKSVADLNKNGGKANPLTEQEKKKLSDELADGYTLLVRTSDSKKGNSQPAFVEIKEAPVIGIKPKTTSGTAVVAVVTKNDKGETTYGDDDVTITYDTSVQGKETIKLAASSDNLFAYSLDGKKFTKIKKNGTILKLSKISGEDIIIRMEGAEDKKKPENSRWASNKVSIPKIEK